MAAAGLAGPGIITQSFAGIGEGNGEIGADYGRLRFDPELLGESGQRWALRAGRHVVGSLECEAEITRARAETEPFAGARRSVTLDEVLFNVAFNFHPRRGIVPYVLAGVGLARLELEAVGLVTSDRRPGYQIAGGSRFFLGDRSPAALRIELAILGSNAFEHSYFHPALSAGLTFRLGREPH